MFNPKKNNRGQVLVLVAIALVVIIGFAALAIDIGYFYHTKNQLQGAADAAALAGAEKLGSPNDTTQQASKDEAVLFGGLNSAAGRSVVLSPATDVTVGNWTLSNTPPYTPGVTPVNAVQVKPRIAVNRLFGKIFRSDQQSIPAQAIATKPPRSSMYFSICADACAGSTCTNPNVCSTITPTVMDTGQTTTFPKQLAWTSLTLSPTSASGVSGLLCGAEPFVDNCGKDIYATNGVVNSTFQDLESLMYNPQYQTSEKDISSGGTVTGWWVIIPVVSCPPSATSPVLAYAKIHITAICGQGAAGCGGYSSPAGVCTHGFWDTIRVDSITCLPCNVNYGGFKPILVQ
jgi:hypothetical protein